MRAEEQHYTHAVIETVSLASLADAAWLMRRRNVGTLAACSASGGRMSIRMIGDRDIIYSTLALGPEPYTLTVGDSMRRPVVTLPAPSTVSEALVAMHAHGSHCPPICDTQGQFSGLYQPTGCWARYHTCRRPSTRPRRACRCKG